MAFTTPTDATQYAVKLLATDVETLTYLIATLSQGKPTPLKREQLRRQLAGVIADLEVIKAGLA